MAYMAYLQSGLLSVIAAGEAGRTSLAGMLMPLDGAISDMTGAVSGLESASGVSTADGAKLKRTLRAVTAAQATAAQVASTYGSVATASSEVPTRLGALGDLIGLASSAANRVSGQVSPSLVNILSTSTMTQQITPTGDAVTPYPHLLILQPIKAIGQPYYFNLSTSAFDELSRKTGFRWAGQERLGRDISQQAVGQGEDKLTIKGAIFPGFRGGLGQLEALRTIGRKLVPVSLTTGYGHVLGNWCLTGVDEDQSHLLAGGIPRKQSFSLEFVKYGDDLQNL